MLKKLSIKNILSGFESGQIDKDELEEIIKDLVKKDSPNKKINEIDYTEDGIVITLDDGQTIEISIDWEEIVLEEG